MPFSVERTMIHFVVHDENDAVGVVVVEGVKKGQKLTGWIMDQDKDLSIEAKSDIPIGHKLAIKPLAKDATVIKYGTDIGRVVAPIQVGEHAHVHNIKTKRW
jgi:(2R)-sulfolactate sulfo-lyase subunit alpha